MYWNLTCLSRISTWEDESHLYLVEKKNEELWTKDFRLTGPENLEWQDD